MLIGLIWRTSKYFSHCFSAAQIRKIWCLGFCKKALKLWRIQRDSATVSKILSDSFTVTGNGQDSKRLRTARINKSYQNRAIQNYRSFLWIIFQRENAQTLLIKWPEIAQNCSDNSQIEPDSKCDPNWVKRRHMNDLLSTCHVITPFGNLEALEKEG